MIEAAAAVTTGFRILFTGMILFVPQKDSEPAKDRTRVHVLVLDVADHVPAIAWGSEAMKLPKRTYANVAGKGAAKPLPSYGAGFTLPRVGTLLEGVDSRTSQRVVARFDLSGVTSFKALEAKGGACQWNKKPIANAIQVDLAAEKIEICLSQECTDKDKKVIASQGPTERVVISNLPSPDKTSHGDKASHGDYADASHFKLYFELCKGGGEKGADETPRKCAKSSEEDPWRKDPLWRKLFDKLAEVKILVAGDPTCPPAEAEP